jgi:hypothetical protein
MIKAGDVISYWDMCGQERSMLQKGMNFRVHGKVSVLLMSLRRGAPYADRVEENGRVLIYEGHDMPRRAGVTDPKSMDQPMRIDGKLTQNGLFYEAAHMSKSGEQKNEIVKVYEKIRAGIWTYNGRFSLLDAWQEQSGARRVFKYRLEVVEKSRTESDTANEDECTRIIPSPVKIEVWSRDKGQCVLCGRSDDLHFDHIIPFSKGGSSLTSANIQLLCSRCNLLKSDKIL